MDQCEEEFEFQSEKKRTKPRILVPLPENAELNKTDGQVPPFLAGLKVDKAARQAVNTKLDSILIKGSKILATSPKSEYVAPSLFLMAKTYFYREEWLPSQIKCSELIDKEPIGKWSADAHLLLAMNLLMQGKYESGITMLSRTVDVAWLNTRYDILTKAFNIEAEMALFRGNLDDALRPYFQAIAQSDDNAQRALWQNELASILFRMHKWDRAEKAYANVMKYSPDLTTEYEAKLYRASCLIRLDRYIEAERILSRLDDDGKFEDWKDYVATQRMIQTLLSGNKEQIIQMELRTDSLFPTSVPKTAYYFEKGLAQFESGDYLNARSSIGKARISIPAISAPSNRMFIFMNQREQYVQSIADSYEAIEKLKNPPEAIVDTSNSNAIAEKDATSDTSNVVVKEEAPAKTESQLLIEAAKSYFELARMHANIGHNDSANYFYKKAADVAPTTEPNSSRYLYVYAESIRPTNAWQADSILNIIAETQPKTEYGQVALARLGYTAAFVTDTAKMLYNSGYELMKYNEYALAKERLTKVFTTYPDNDVYAPKALYALGYLYENRLKMPDSANYYYLIILQKYPTSEYAKELALPTTYKDLVDNNMEIPDSLKTRIVELYTADTSIIHKEYDSTLLANPNKDGGFSFDDLKNPSKLLDKAKKKIQDKIDAAKEVVNDPNKLLDDAIEGAKGAVKVPKVEDFVPGEKKEGEGEEDNNPEDEKKPEEEKKPEGS
jgi:tetratricopeptide (TPR) repeat protein